MNIFKICPWLDPSNVTYIPMEVSFEQIGLEENKENVDLLLSMITTDEDVDTVPLVNSLLDIRNSLE